IVSAAPALHVRPTETTTASPDIANAKNVLQRVMMTASLFGTGPPGLAGNAVPAFHCHSRSRAKTPRSRSVSCALRPAADERGRCAAILGHSPATSEDARASAA